MPNAIFFYRIERWLYLHHIPFLPRLVQLIIFLLYNTRVTGKASIGHGTFFVCKGLSCCLHDKTVIGDNCRIGMHVVIVGQTPYKEVPKIGNNVWIGPNAIIQGPVIIEDGVIIAAGSLVNKSVPKNAIVAGVPARIIGNTKDLQYDILEQKSGVEGYRPFLKEK